MTQDPTAKGLALIRIFLGVFFVFEAMGKLTWLLDSQPLVERLNGYLAQATVFNRGYLEGFALPYAWLLARLVMLGELATGIALVLGVWTRIAAAAAFLMVLNIHVGSGALFQYRFLTNGYGLPVLGPLLGLAIGGKALPWSLKRR
jgi:uncharacterized membrane protein YphA (DoxX/SURF4 family)